MFDPGSLRKIRLGSPTEPPRIGKSWEMVRIDDAMYCKNNRTFGVYWTLLRSAHGSQVGSVCRSYSMKFAIIVATSLPYTVWRKSKIASIPALTPDAVQIFPSTTHLALPTQSTWGLVAEILANAILFVVARLPSNTPALATTPEPVRTVKMY